MTTGSTIILTGTIDPIDATNQAIVWSVADGDETGAIITEGNKLSADYEGIVEIQATIKNGKPGSVDYVLTIPIRVELAAP